jgi:hypothetical protein
VQLLPDYLLVRSTLIFGGNAKQPDCRISFGIPALLHAAMRSAAAPGPPSPATDAELAELRRRVASLSDENEMLRAAATPVFLAELPDDIADWSAARGAPSPPSPPPPPPLPSPLPPPPPLQQRQQQPDGLAPGDIIILHKINMHKLLWIILTLVLTFIVVVGVALLVTIGPKPTYSGNVTDTSGD